MRNSMLRSIKSLTTSPSSHVLRRGYASEAVPERKVAVLGAAGGIGQSLSLLMKLNPLVSNLALYDIANTPGVAADVSHINTRSEVYIPYLYKRYMLSLLFSSCCADACFFSIFYYINM
jgi:malate dehydrogenase